MKNICSQCGICCSLFLINLNEEEYYSGKYDTQFNEFGLILGFKKASACGANLLNQKKNGECIYLKNNKCSIHKTRPQVCREFFCASKSKKFDNMVKLIKKKKLEKQKTYFVYILRTSSNTLYIGQTNNLEKRLKEHQGKSAKSAKYVRYFKSVELVYSEQYSTRGEAMKREWQIKKLTHRQKEEIIAKK